MNKSFKLDHVKHLEVKYNVNIEFRQVKDRLYYSIWNPTTKNNSTGLVIDGDLNKYNIHRIEKACRNTRADNKIDLTSRIAKSEEIAINNYN